MGSRWSRIIFRLNMQMGLLYYRNSLPEFLSQSCGWRRFFKFRSRTRLHNEVFENITKLFLKCVNLYKKKYIYINTYSVWSFYSLWKPAIFRTKIQNFSLDQATEEATTPETFCFANILFFFKCCDNYYIINLYFLSFFNQYFQYHEKKSLSNQNRSVETWKYKIRVKIWPKKICVLYEPVIPPSPSDRKESLTLLVLP